jgi:hypothetical protein
MAKSKGAQPISAHQDFSQQCFNKAWDLMEKPDRTPKDDEQMVLLNQASIWHWTQREDCTPKHLSIGYWQASRIYSMLNEPVNARRFGQLSLDYSREEDAFYQAYAYEALARAEHLAGDHPAKENYLKRARELTATISDRDERSIVAADLDSIK